MTVLLAVLVYAVTYLVVATIILAPTFASLVYAFDRSIICGQGARLIVIVASLVALFGGQYAAIHMLEVAW